LWVYYRLEAEPVNAHAQAFLALLRQRLDDDPDVLHDAQVRQQCCPAQEERSS